MNGYAYINIQIDEMKLEITCFQRLKEIEDKAVGRRFSKMQTEVSQSISGDKMLLGLLIDSVIDSIYLYR